LLHSKKFWVVSTYVWVKSNEQTQTIGFKMLFKNIKQWFGLSLLDPTRF